MTAQILADVEFNLDDLSLGDLIDIERVSGVKVSDRALTEPPMALAAAFLWVVRRRDDPTLTFEAVCAMPVTKLQELAPDPKGAGRKAASGTKRAD